MLNLFRRPKPNADGAAAEWCPSVGEGRRVYAIGDVHGRLDLFRELTARVIDDSRARGAADHLEIVLLGDLVDRGPDSAGVVDLVQRLCADWPIFTCLMGNHEEVFLMALSGDMGALRFFKKIGGRETLLSYGVPADLIDGDDDEALFERMMQCVPQSHYDFIAGLPSSVQAGDYLFVHAGIRPGVAIEDQDPRDMHWIRDEFLKSTAAHPRCIVHGHSITQFVDEHSHRIGIDTGAYATSRLTAIGLEGTRRWYLST